MFISKETSRLACSRYHSDRINTNLKKNSKYRLNEMKVIFVFKSCILTYKSLPVYNKLNMTL